MEFSNEEVEVLRCWFWAHVHERQQDAFGFREIDDELVLAVALRLAANDEETSEIQALGELYRRDMARWASR